MTAFSIGYGGRKPADFLALLTAQRIKTIVDVRLRPDKASMGSYVEAREPEKGIAGMLTRSGIGYISLPELGNLFLDFPDWPSRYADFLDRAGPLLFDRLTTDIPAPFCLLCAEKKVAECHRRHIAGYLARTRGWDFTHIE